MGKNFINSNTNVFPYNRKKAYYYMSKWALSRNTNYYDFENSGGDCTNFVSQTLYHAGCSMNYSKNGWFYINHKNRSPSWTSVEQLHRFIINNKHVGPTGHDASIQELDIGDIVQIKFPQKKTFTHTTLICEKLGNSIDQIYIAAHSIDRFRYRLSNYEYEKIRFIAIDGYRIE